MNRLPALAAVALAPVALLALPLLSCAPAERAPEPGDAPPARALVDPAWVVQHEDSTQRFIGLSIVDSLTVWVAGQPGLWGRTTDGGATWTVAEVPGADTLAFRDGEPVLSWLPQVWTQPVLLQLHRTRGQAWEPSSCSLRTHSRVPS